MGLAIQDLFKKRGDELNLEETEPERVSEININVGSTGILNVETVDKSLKYESLLGEITPDIIRDIARILEESKTKTQAFTKLEDAKISLEYLIALGITSEEQIYAYQVIRSRGILEDLSSNIQKVKSTVDEDYALEIIQLERPLPVFRDINDQEIPETLTLKELTNQQVERIIELESQVRQLELNLEQERAYYQEQLQQGVEDEDTQYEKGVLTALKETHEVDLFDLTVKTEEEEAQQKEVQAWQEALSKVKQLAEQHTKESEDSGESEVVDTVEGETRTVYILSTVFNTPQIEGYTIKFIEKPVDLNYFTASKDNLLIITDNIPRYIVTIFVNWINGISTNTDRRYRIVTLEGSELTHALIEGTVELTKESLDNYYNVHTLEQYTGSGVGSFLDISHLLDEDE